MAEIDTNHPIPQQSDLLELIDQEVHKAEHAVAELAPVFEQAQQRLIKARVVQEYLRNLVVPTEAGPAKPSKLLVEVLVQKQETGAPTSPDAPLAEAAGE